MRAAIDTVIRSLRGLSRPSRATNLRQLQARGEAVESFRFRDATADDIPALARLHVTTWSDTYGARNPPSYELRHRQWRETFDRVKGSWFCIVIERPGGDLVGFATAERYRDEELSALSGQLSKIYLLREYQRLGLGRRLVGHVARRFLDQGINSMVLFGIPQNLSCAAWEALGGDRLSPRERGEQRDRHEPPGGGHGSQSGSDA